ncbi:MAG TPA: hypothetical protein VFE38_01690 [Edaphobacter sp.]|nr:hypothetical protein [Edaphobacter sp.]
MSEAKNPAFVLNIVILPPTGGDDLLSWIKSATGAIYTSLGESPQVQSYKTEAESPTQIRPHLPMAALVLFSIRYQSNIMLKLKT